VTLVTFGSLNRLSTFELTRQRWDTGQAVLVIPLYRHTPELEMEARQTMRELRLKAWPNTLVRHQPSL